MALSDRQRRFVEAYAISLSAKEAATVAGYSARTARQSGSRLLALPEVAAAIQQALEQRAEHCDVKAWQVLHELKRIAFSEDERTSDKLKACELLAKHLQLFGSEAAVVVGRVTLEQLVPRRKEHPPAPPPPAEKPPEPKPPRASDGDGAPQPPREPRAEFAEMAFDPFKTFRS